MNVGHKKVAKRNPYTKTEQRQMSFALKLMRCNGKVKLQPKERCRNSVKSSYASLMAAEAPLDIAGGAKDVAKHGGKVEIHVAPDRHWLGVA